MRIMIASDYDVNMYNGRYYFSSAFYTILKRYYEAFGRVVLFTRTVCCNDFVTDKYDSTDMIEYLVEARGFLAVLNRHTQKEVRSQVQQCDLIIVRVPSLNAYFAADTAKKSGKPYFAEVMGCAWDAYSHHGFIGKLIAPYMYFKMKTVVKNADYSLYVTERYLQNKYPCDGASINASNVNISINNNLEARLEKIKKLNKNRIVLMTAAAIDVRYKGQEYVIKAIPLLNKMGIHVEYKLIGNGDKSYLYNIAKECNVLNQIEFVGGLSHKNVLNQMDDADIYIQPSLQEGLPRSMIEAMSRGCICMGANTAGIPELIDAKFIFKRKNYFEIADIIERICNTKNIETEVYKNYEKSKEYDNALLNKKRNLFYQNIIEKIENR